MVIESALVSNAIAEHRRALRVSVARELHDGPIQSLTESVLKLERYRSAAANPEMQSAISDVEESVRIALMSLRHLVSDLRDERPEEDLAASITAMAARYRASSGLEIEVVVAPDWPADLPVNTALNLIRIAREAITNALRHGGGPQVLVELGTDEDHLTLTVSDDGRGIPAEAPAGAGLIGMKERAALIGGRLSIRGRNPGTQVRVEIARP